jgi:HPt (histidine-containing phosphotransfer) domain-containing protein
MDDYLSKPLQFQQLQIAIARWIGAEVELNSHQEDGNKKSTLTPVDLERLREFTDGDKDMGMMVINLFLEKGRESIDAMRQATQNNASYDWENAAHSFKDASGNLGAMILHTLCSQAEHAYDRLSGSRF